MDYRSRNFSDCWKLCLQETLHCSFSACSSRPRTSSRSGSSSSAPQWTNAVNMSSSESSVGFQRQQRYWLVLSRHSQPWKADREGQQRCDVGRSATPRQSSFTPSTSPTDSVSLTVWGYMSIRLSTQACNRSTKAKNPQTESSWEDNFPSRSTATNQKCSESSSRSPSPCPLSYSNPCITSVYARNRAKGSSQNFTHRGQTKELSYGREGVWTRFVVRSTVKKKKKESQSCCGACRVVKSPKEVVQVVIRSPRWWVHTCERGRSIADVDCAVEGVDRLSLQFDT